ncbi:cytochrome c-L [uncultured bacterium]|nr:cytochrome c-L [uncultured bacterium]
MKKISMAVLTLALGLGVITGCSEKKEPAEKAQTLQQAPAPNVTEPPVEEKKVAEAATVATEQAPAPPPAVKDKTAVQKAPVQVAVNEAPAQKPVDVEAGAALYKSKCSPCHGVEGKGTTMAPALKGNEWIKASSNADVTNVIRKGRQGSGKKYANFFVDMPPTKGLAETDEAVLIGYLRSLNK